MFAVDVCDLPVTGNSTFVIVAGLFLLIAGVIVTRWGRTSAGQLSIVAAPLVFLGGLALAPSFIDPCVSTPTTTIIGSTTTTTVPSTTTTVPSTTTTVPSTTTTVPSTTVVGVALTPTFGTPTATADGFTVPINNYDSSYTWAGTATASGTVSISGTGLVTVTGVAAGTSSTATITTTRTGYAVGTADVTATSLSAALTPAFGTPTATADGFIVVISNYNSSYTWAGTATASGTVVVSSTGLGSVSISGTGLVTVTGVAPGTSSTATITTTRTGYAGGTADVTATSVVGTALVPTITFGTPTADGFTVQITNYDANFSWSGTEDTGGTVSIDNDGLVTVTGVAAGTSSTATITTTRPGYAAGTALVTDTSLDAALTPTFGTPTATADGFTVPITNYEANFTWAGNATASGSVSISGTGLVTVTSVAPETSSTATITTTRTGYAGGTADVTATSLVDMIMVTVGNPGNVADYYPYGAVSYAYQIGKYDVTGSQYTAFLNAVASTDTHGLYNADMGTDSGGSQISRFGSHGSYTYAVMNSTGQRPITNVSWFDSARFANWMSNGQPSGAQISTTTENGAYNVNGATSGNAVAKNGTNPNTSTAPTFHIPLENEWYKAAYYSPNYADTGVGNYWSLATQSHSDPGTTIGSSANQANYNNVIGRATDVGSFSGSGSFYGTFDQSGNVWQWNDYDGSVGSSRGLRGGDWSGTFYNVYAGAPRVGSTAYENNGVGFRLASPVTTALTPTFGSTTATANGFTVQITNYDSAYTWTGTSSDSGGTVVVSGTGLVTVTGVAALTSSTATITTSKSNTVGGSADVTATSLAAALTPTFGSTTATTVGFTVQINNYNSNYTWAGNATASGSVSISGTGLVTVTGVASNTSSTATITTTRTGHAGGTANVTATSVLTPTFGSTTATTDGFTVQITNYDSSYTWAGTSSDSGVSVAISSSGLVTVTGVATDTGSMATITTTKSNTVGGTATVIEYQEGDFGPGGGKIFHVDTSRPEGSRFFEAACNGWASGTCGDEPAVGWIWGCYNQSISGATGTAIGTGEANTLAIVNGCSANTAAKKAYDLVFGEQDDWFLPSKLELLELCRNKHGTTNWSYASSTQTSSTLANTILFSSNCGVDTLSKSSFERIRPIRSF